MKTAILCISDNYGVRGHALARLYASMNDEVCVVVPDFSHREKRFIQPQENEVLVHHLPYQKNLSLTRLAGHYLYARGCRQFLEQYQPDRIHCLVPANSMASQMAAYKKAHPEVQLIFDVNDLWPESFPLGAARKLPGMKAWQNLRDKNLSKADLVFTECSRFAHTLQSHLPRAVQTLYWSIPEEKTDSSPHPDNEMISLCYLGSVANITDIEYFVSLVKELSQLASVHVHFMAAGEKKDELVGRIGQYASVSDHGAVYESQAKQDIFDQCHFGLNLMKPTLSIGLSMKTIDYLQGGLPVLNRLPGDTWDWIEQDGCGLNLPNDPAQAARNIQNALAENKAMRRQAKKVYEDNLSAACFAASFQEGLKKGNLHD